MKRDNRVRKVEEGRKWKGRRKCILSWNITNISRHWLHIWPVKYTTWENSTGMRWVEDTGGTEGAEISGVYIKLQNIYITWDLWRKVKTQKQWTATEIANSMPLCLETYRTLCTLVISHTSPHESCSFDDPGKKQISISTDVCSLHAFGVRVCMHRS